jgi:hypothetical protein
MKGKLAVLLLLASASAYPIQPPQFLETATLLTKDDKGHWNSSEVKVRLQNNSEVILCLGRTGQDTVVCFYAQDDGQIYTYTEPVPGQHST